MIDEDEALAAYEVIEQLAKLANRAHAQLNGRAATIRRLWATIQQLRRQRETALRWLRGEFADTGLGDPMAGKPWLCMWCGEMIQGGRAAASDHVQGCEQNPLVRRIRELERKADDRASHETVQ